MNKSIKIDEILELVNCIHETADFYQRSGFTTEQFISSFPNIEDKILQELTSSAKQEVLGNMNPEMLTWGEACALILRNKEEYKDVLRLLSYNPYCFKERIN